MPELSTLGGVIKPAYEGETNTNAFTDAEKAKLAALAEVASSGSYTDLTDKPAIPSGAYADLTGRPVLAPVATSGTYADLTGKPALDFIPTNQKGVANGVAPLDAAGFVPAVHLNVSGLSFKGAWDPTTNTPALVDGTGSVGDFYKASAAGTFNFGNGTYTFNEGDWAIFAAGVWQRIGSSELVASVNGKVGDVVLTATDVGARPSTYVPAWSEVTAKPTLTNTVNGQSGAVVLNAASVGARPSTYVPDWSEITGKPTVRGTIGPAIPAFRARINTAQAIPTGVATQITNFGTPERDPFGMAVGGEIVLPAWATHYRVTASLRTESLLIDRHFWMAIRRGTSNVSAGQVMGTLDATNPTVSLISGITPVEGLGSGNINLSVFHNNGNSRNILIGFSSFIDIELYE